MSRGNERQPIVRDDADRQRRLDWLRRTIETYGWRLHAFVLMANHDHLFVETPEANLAAGMQYLNGSYTSYFNRRHRRVGHLFQGRFRGHLIEEEGYFLEVSRYIHLNPVRARLVGRPEQWPWGSYPGYHQERRALDWVTYAAVLGEFGRARPPAPICPLRSGRDGRAALLAVCRGDGRASAGLGGLRRKDQEVAGRPAVRFRRAAAETAARRPSMAEIAAMVAGHFGNDPTCWAHRPP